MNVQDVININTNTYAAPQTLEHNIARFRTLEQRRIAVRRALYTHPDDPTLRQAARKLARPYQLQRAALKGIFISYARADELFALELAMRLNESGFNVWLDMLDMDNTDWERAVYHAMRNSGVMLAIMSPRAAQDSALWIERERFANMGKLVLPVIRRPCDLHGMDLWLNPVDFSRDFVGGLGQLKRLLRPVENIA